MDRRAPRPRYERFSGVAALLLFSAIPSAAGTPGVAMASRVSFPFEENCGQLPASAAYALRLGTGVALFGESEIVVADGAAHPEPLRLKPAWGAARVERFRRRPASRTPRAKIAEPG